MMKKIQVYLLTITVIVISLFVYFMLNFRQGIHIEETMITHSTIPARFSGTRLIQLSDTKIKTKKDLSLLKKTVEEINKLGADIVVFTGDLFEKGAISSDLSKQVEKTLSELNPSLAKVAVLGDTDLKQKKEITKILTGASFKILRNESIELYNGSSEGIQLIGIDSLSTTPDLTHILEKESSSEMFQVLLLHEPTLAAKVTDYPINLQLSGHCQGNSTKNGCTQFYNGTYPFADQLILNVNPGLKERKGIFSFFSRPTIHSFLLIKS